MIIFKNSIDEKYIFTNYKVMYSTFMEQENLVFQQKNIVLLFNLLIGSLTGKKQLYLIVRSPYDRAVSFFKNKFRSTLHNIVQNEKWQYCHEIFFPYLLINKEKDSFENIAHKLENISFNEFIVLLPKVYQLDGHLYPQYWIKYFRYKKHLIFKLPFKFKMIYKLENTADLTHLKHTFNLDLSINENATKHISTPINWTVKERKIINTLYHYDFKYFKYKKRYN